MLSAVSQTSASGRQRGRPKPRPLTSLRCEVNDQAAIRVVPTAYRWVRRRCRIQREDRTLPPAARSAPSTGLAAMPGEANGTRGRVSRGCGFPRGHFSAPPDCRRVPALLRLRVERRVETPAPPRSTDGDDMRTALIADTDKRFAASLHTLIQEVVRVVGEAQDDETAISQAQELEPEVILIDLDLPRAGGIETARRIKERVPGIRVVLMTAHGEEAYLEGTGKSHADVLLPKRYVRTDPSAALRRLRAGVLR